MSFDPEQFGDAAAALEKLTDLKPYQKKHTPCVTCVFAEYQEDGENGLPTQTGCQIGMLEKLTTVGNAEIIAASDKEKNFFVVAKRDCPGNRGKKWAEHWTAKGKDLVQAFTEDFFIRFEAIVVCTATNTFEEVKTTIENIKKAHSILPQKILVTNQNRKINPISLKRIIQEGRKVDWSVEQVIDVQASVGRCIDLAVKKVSRPYYLVVMAGETLPFDYIGLINAAVCDRLSQFVILTPLKKSLTGLYCSVKAHKAFKGFMPVEDEEGNQLELSVVEKIRQGLEEEECPELLLTPKEIGCHR